MRYLIFDPDNNFYSFGNLEEDSPVPDFIIYCHGYTFIVHRLMLKTWIPYFQHLDSFKEGKSEDISLEDERYNPDIIHALLAYCHCRDLDLETEDLLSLIQHAGYWQYDDFIMWVLRKYAPPEFPLLYGALQELCDKNAKLEVALMILPLIETPLQEDGHVFLTWLKEIDPASRDKILTYLTCPDILREGYKLISEDQIIIPEFTFKYKQIPHGARRSRRRARKS